MRKEVKKYISFLLLLLLIEKAGVRLLIHDKYHKASIAAITNSSNNKSSVSQSNDGCLEDFFLALHHTETFAICLPLPIWSHQSFPGYKGNIPSFSSNAGHLRGPPIS
jgi:hypothetical protein